MYTLFGKKNKGAHFPQLNENQTNTVLFLFENFILNFENFGPNILTEILKSFFGLLTSINLANESGEDDNN